MAYKHLHPAQTGSALIVSLVMLLLISLIGVSSMQGTILQERMASNLHSRNLAFQASEHALRVGEGWLTSNALAAQTNNRLADPSEWGGTGTDSVSVASGNGQLAKNPSYHVGWVSVFCPSIQAGSPCFDRFAVTSYGQGGTDTTVSILQSMYMPLPL